VLFRPRLFIDITSGKRDNAQITPRSTLVAYATSQSEQQAGIRVRYAVRWLIGWVQITISRKRNRREYSSCFCFHIWKTSQLMTCKRESDYQFQTSVLDGNVFLGCVRDCFFQWSHHCKRALPMIVLTYAVWWRNIGQSVSCSVRKCVHRSGIVVETWVWWGVWLSVRLMCNVI
jgi:hypothetical protein